MNRTVIGIPRISFACAIQCHGTHALSNNVVSRVLFFACVHVTMLKHSTAAFVSETLFYILINVYR